MSVQKNNGPIIDPGLCRCCRAIKKCRILTAEYTWMGKKEVYADMVMDCYGILLSHVDDNEKDCGVCATCVVRLREAIAFRHQVLQCEELFLHAKLEGPPDEEKEESKLKKLDLELKTEPKDYNSDHNSMDDHDNDVCVYSDDDADDNKPLKKEEPKPEEPPLKDEEPKSEASVDFNGDSSSDSDEPIKKKMKRKAKSKANGAKKKPAKAAKKQKAETDATETIETTEMEPIEFKIEIEENMEFNIEDEEAVQSKLEVFDVENSETTVVSETIVRNEITDSKDATESQGNAESQGTSETGKKKKRIWVRLSRNEMTEYQHLCQELESNEDLYFKHYNMSKDSFEELFKMIEDSIEKEVTNYRKPIFARERLAVFLRYLKTGDSYKTISVSHGIGNSSVSNIVGEVSKAIWEVLQPTYMPAPNQYTWTQSERGFREFKNFPNCVGSIGGRHVIVNSRGHGAEKVSVYYSHYSSLVLLAVTDAFNNFTVIDLGNYGGFNDLHCFEFSSFYRDFIEDNELLPPKPLPGNEILVRHVLIGDESFTLRPYLMRAFPSITKNPNQINFNQRIQNARTTDTVFSMLIENWHIFSRPIGCSLATAITCVKAACCLHNYIQSKHGNLERQITEGTSKPTKKRKVLKGLVHLRALNSRSTNIAMVTREKFVRYFSRTMETGGDLLTVQRLSSSVEAEKDILRNPIKMENENLVDADAIQVENESLKDSVQETENSEASLEVENEVLNDLIEVDKEVVKVSIKEENEIL